MGSCLSKKESTSTTTTSAVTVTNKTTPLPDPPSKDEENKKKSTITSTIKTTTTTTTTKNPHKEETGVAGGGGGVMKKEVFVIKQRRSHERRPSEGKITISTPTTSNNDNKLEDPSSSSSGEGVNGGGGVVERSGVIRTSSCTKEEVDAILIQCGRLSRSSSGNNLNGSNAKKYSGSKRSYDFDHDAIEKGGDDDVDNVGIDTNSSHHHQRRHSRSSHRRTPSRDKDVEGGGSSTKRSGSREKRSSSREDDRTRSNGGGGSRRVSRSPGRRSETPSGGGGGGGGVTEKSRPGKMVSVPASNRGGAGGGDSGTMGGPPGVKRVATRRSGEMGRTAIASPRSQSPANVRGSGTNNENHHQHPHSLSRSNSRKAEHSPYRRNPMTEIDDNSQRPNEINNLKNQKLKDIEPGLNKKSSHLQSQQKSEMKTQRVAETIVQETNNNGSRDVKENIGLSTGAAVGESLKPQGITRTRSARRSRDFDLNSAMEPDTILNPTSYASLLLEDIQNFHQQNATTTTPTAATAATAFTLPACVTKACSILDAVADLNSCASSNISSDDRNCFEVSDNRSNNNKSFSKSTTNVAPFNPLGKKRMDVKKKTYVESELVVGNEEEEDLMEPSLHKYITVRRGVNEEKDMEQQESSGSNSVIAAQHNWASSSSSWEPNSADSTDRWTSRSNTTGGEEEPSLVISEKVKQQQNISATPMRRKKETSDHQGKVIGGGVRGQMRIPIAAASM